MKRPTVRSVRQFIARLPGGHQLDVLLAKYAIRSGKVTPYVPVAELSAAYQRALEDLTSNGVSAPTYFEAGVFSGVSMGTWWGVVDSAGVPMRAFGADSFQGLPSSVENDEGGWEEGMFWCPRPATEWNLRRMGVPMADVKLIEGWFDESLTPELGQEVGTVHVAMLDADAYSSTVPVLDFLTPILANRAWLIFDDWYSGGNLDSDTGVGRGTGVERAFTEWLAAHPEWSSQDKADYELELNGETQKVGKVFLVTRD